MRNLKTSDLFSLSKVIKKMNIKDEIKSLVQDISTLDPDKKAKAQAELQVSLTMLFVENIGAAEKEIYNLFADLTGKTAKEIENLDLGEFMNLITELFAQESFGSFFSVALK